MPMDIPTADIPKFKARILAYLLQRELANTAKDYGLDIPAGKSFMDAIHDDLATNPNPVVRKIHLRLLEAGSYMHSSYHGAIIADLGSFILWICLADTAYAPVMTWLIDVIGNDKELLMQNKDYLQKPEDWFCPRWVKSKDNTRMGRENGRLGRFDMSKDEEIFTPPKQLEKWMQMINEQLNTAVKQKKLRD